MNFLLSNAQLDICDQYSEKFREISRDSYSEFAGLIDIYGQKNRDNLFWWVSSTASRSQLQSNLYRDYCTIKLVAFLHQENILPHQIIVRSEAIKSALQQIPLFQKIAIHSSNKYYKIWKYIHILIQPIHFLFNKILQKLLISFYFNKPKNLEHKVIVESFVSPLSISDRYYPNIENFIDITGKEIIYLPTIIDCNIFSSIKLIKKLKSSTLSPQYIFKESFISYRNIFQAAFYRNYSQSFTCSSCDVDISNISFNMLPLVEDALKKEKFSSLSAEGILNYSLIKNLSKLNFTLDTFIDWWENTAMDKGLNLGFHHFYNRNIAKGYMGFIPNQFCFELSPSKLERQSGVIPRTIGVMGKVFLDIPRRIDNDQFAEIAPALRFNHLFNDCLKHDASDNSNILVALPAYEDKAYNILKIILRSIEKLQGFNFIVKTHPACNINIKSFQGLPSNVKFNSESTMNELIHSSILMITGASSASVEAIMLNLPVMNIRATQSPFDELIPDGLPSHIFHNFRLTEDFAVQTIRLIKLNTRKKNLSINIDDYFCNPTSKNVKLFFNLSA
jgi:hypothetical protein